MVRWDLIRWAEGDNLLPIKWVEAVRWDLIRWVGEASTKWEVKIRWVEVARWEVSTKWEVKWEVVRWEVNKTGNKILFTTKIRNGVKVATLLCLNGKTNTTPTSLLSNLTRNVENAMELELFNVKICPSPVEIATENKVFVLNASEEELTISMENPVKNVKEVNGKKKEEREAKIKEVPAAPAMIIATGAENMEEIMEDNKVLEGREDLEVRAVSKDTVKEVMVRAVMVVKEGKEGKGAIMANTATSNKALVEDNRASGDSLAIKMSK